MVTLENRGSKKYDLKQVNMIVKSMKYTIVLSAVVMICNAGYSQKGTEENKPNIIVILADDLGNNDVGFNGCKDIPTPNIDRIASEGVRFSQGYVTFAVCGPSRAGLITGRYQDRFGFARTPVFAPSDPEMGLPRSEQTMAEMLKTAGYRTMLAGKWHVGAHAEVHHPNKRGFDEFFGFLAGGHRYFPEDWTIPTAYEAEGNEEHGYRTILQHNGRIVENEKEYLTDALSREAVNFVKKNKEQPFFLYLAYNAPHTPLQATDKYLDRFRYIADEKRRIYAAMVSAMDDGIGRVLDQLEASGMAENTVVFFLSDNGGPQPVNGSDNGVLRGGKSSWYEGGIRVPFAMRWPRKVKPGQVCDLPVISLDIFATLVANIGQSVEVRNKLDGIDLIPVITGQKESVPERTLFWSMYDRNLYVARNGNGAFKILTKPNGNELYNLDKDISEKNNLLKDNKDKKVYESLINELETWKKEMRKPAFLGLGQVKEYWKWKRGEKENK